MARVGPAWSEGLSVKPMQHSVASGLKISLIINTACADPVVRQRNNPFRAACYGERAGLLEKEILPRSAGFDEVVVAGSFPPQLKERFPLVRFVPVPPQRRDRWDALFQREVGARFTTGDILVFCHDDHAPDDRLAAFLRELPPDIDILVPKRVHLRTGAVLENGKADGYMGGHCYAMRRWIWASVSLTLAPNEYWDVYLTPIWKNAGANIVWSDDAIHYDCEAREAEI
jgi:hypothetical protein